MQDKEGVRYSESGEVLGTRWFLIGKCPSRPGAMSFIYPVDKSGGAGLLQSFVYRVDKA